MAKRTGPTTISVTGPAGAVLLACRKPDNRATVLIASAPAGSTFQIQTSADYATNVTPSWSPSAVFDTNLPGWIIGTNDVTPSSYPYCYDLDMANRKAVRIYAVDLQGGSASVSLFTDNFYTSSPPIPGPTGPSGPSGSQGASGPSGPSGPSGWKYA